MDFPKLYRKRIIPPECIQLKDDQIVSYESDRLVTIWRAIRPKKNLHHGISCYFFEDGFKVSKFYKEDGTLLYWYCDIIVHEFDRESGNLVVTDLLADVIIYPDGFVKVVDIDELADALDSGSISVDLLQTSLRSLDYLLSLIYSGDFKRCQDYLEQFEA